MPILSQMSISASAHVLLHTRQGEKMQPNGTALPDIRIPLLLPNDFNASHGSTFQPIRSPNLHFY